MANILVGMFSPIHGVRLARNYTIFEGTSEIQRLVVARAISGLHIA